MDTMEGAAGSFVAKKAAEQSGKDSLCPSLTLKQRVIGYATVVILGIIDFN